MRKFGKILAVTLAAFMLVTSMSVSAMDIRQWGESEIDTSLRDITNNFTWESGTYTTSSNVQTKAAAADQIRTTKNLGARQILIECAPGYQLKFAECINSNGTLTVKRKYGPSFKLPQQEWLDFTYLNTYKDRDYTIIIKSNDGSAMNAANAADYVTISEVDLRYHVPEYSIDELNQSVEVVNNLQDLPGAFSFIFISDIHLQHNTKHSPAMIRYIKNQCGISEVLGGGDFVTAWLGDKDGIQGLWDDMEELKYLYEDVPILKSLGNHEWGYGGSNQWNITNQQAYNRFYRDYDAYNNNVVYNETRQYFYADDPVNKMRYISVNGMDYPTRKVVAEFSGSNFTRNKSMWYEISDEQVQWLRDEAFRMPDDEWNCLILMHVPIFTTAESPWGYSENTWVYNDNSKNATAHFRAAITDFINKKGDMADAKGNFIGIFNGHEHQEAIYRVDGINNIVTDGDTTISLEKTHERIINTVTEQEFNVVTVDPVNRMVYITKVGAGRDVSFSY